MFIGSNLDYNSRSSGAQCSGDRFAKASTFRSFWSGKGFVWLCVSINISPLRGENRFRRTYKELQERSKLKHRWLLIQIDPLS